MPAIAPNNYVVGKGRVYFDAFLPGTKTNTGEDYLGNTPELSTSQDQSTLDHYDADSGLNVKDESVVIEQNMTGSLTTDNINTENLARWFGGETEDTTIVAVTGATDTVVVKKKGRTIQLGVTALQPSGARNVVNVVAKIGATTVPALANYEVDMALGRVYIEGDAPGIEVDDELVFTYDIEAGLRKTIIGKGSAVVGSMRFISGNPIGSQKDYFWPYVKLTANGDFSLKGDEWQVIPFSFEVLKRDANTERVYIDARS